VELFTRSETLRVKVAMQSSRGRLVAGRLLRRDSMASYAVSSLVCPSIECGWTLDASVGESLGAAFALAKMEVAHGG